MSRMSDLAIEVANGDIPTIRQALRDLVDACYRETSIQGRWKESGPDRCGFCNAAKGMPPEPHKPACEVGRAEKSLVVDVEANDRAEGR